MTRKVRDSGLEGRSARLKLAVRRRPYRGPALGRGIALLYRRNHHNGSWVVKCADGHGGYWTKVIGQADDFDTSDGTKVLDFWQAQDAAKRLARGGADIGTAPVTVDGALIDYKRDLISRGANSSNAVRPRKHLSPVLLAKPVQLLTSKELKTWRDGLLGKLAPASVNRLCNCICAALELARINVTATPPAAGTSKWENTQDDLANLVGAIADANIDASDAVFIANARDAVLIKERAGDLDNDVLSSLAVPRGTIICIAPQGIASAYQGGPVVDIGRESAWQFEANNPQQIVPPGGSPVAQPVFSAFQAGLISIRVRAKCAWCAVAGAVSFIQNASW